MEPSPESIDPLKISETVPSEESHARGVRVAFFSDSLPERNGTGAYYHDLAGQLAPQVEALKIFQPTQRGNNSFLSLPMPGDPMQRLVTPNFMRIRSGYKSLNPHIVVSITPGPFGLLGLALAKLSGSRFISAFHTDFEQLAKIYFNPLSRTFANGYLRTANRILCKKSGVVLVNNSKLEEDVIALGAKGIEVMGTPLQPAFLEKPMQPPPSSVQRICFAGRLAAEKNIDQIIDASKQFPEIEFVIGGDGPLRKKLQDLANGLTHVRFTGWLNRDELIEILDSSSLLLLPSKLETFGSVALEAMSRGRPALVSANAGIHDWPILQDGLFTLQRGDDLATAIERLIHLPADEWQRKASVCRSAAEQLNRETILQWARMLAERSAIKETKAS
ncbi:MAG: glycosyltransferase [Coraliomargaritaceae bacterium]